VGSDVDLDRLQQAGADYCDLISQFGRFAKPSVANVRECLQKISVSKKGLGVSSMLALLEGECAAGAHKPGGVLLDPSGAIGLLWVRRGLLFWAHVFEQQAKVMMRPMRGGGSSLKEQSLRAYEAVVKQFHGWVSARAFKVALGMTPSWDLVRERVGLGDSDDQLRDDLQGWAASMRRLAEVMRTMHEKLDLEDKRKSI